MNYETKALRCITEEITCEFKGLKQNQYCLCETLGLLDVHLRKRRGTCLALDCNEVNKITNAAECWDSEFLVE